MRHPPPTYTNGTSNVVVDEYGSGRHAFWDGSPAMWNVTLGVNGNATEITARWCNDITLNVKNACIEGNGAIGPTGNDVDDDPFELARAVNTAADVLTGESNFVARGLRFTTGPGSLVVTLDDGVIVYGGRKYHVTDDQLAAADFTGTGTAASMTLPASRDCYISIGPIADDDASIVGAGGTMRARFSVTVTDVANGAGTPAVPDGEFVFAMLRSDGSGVPAANVFYRAFPKFSSESRTVELADSTPNSDFGALLMPGIDIGSSTAPADNGDETQGGSFVGTVHLTGIHARTHTTSGRRQDRFTGYITGECSTSGAVTDHINMLTSAQTTALPNNSLIEAEAKIVALADSDDGYTATIRRMLMKTSAGTVQLYGTTEVEREADPDTINCSVDFSLSGGVFRVSCTGVAARDITWVATWSLLQLQGG